MMEPSPGGALFYDLHRDGFVLAAQHQFIVVATHLQHQYRALRLIELAHPMLNCADDHS
ncbi:hypothetical protein IVB38_17765 [Bradyrhizobium sp. 38]|uniref:hypothetical protein n=1 Tax=unclassified Bradyrhizobium TaxID=2631580 RepID=UPI001FF92A2F|nr:MULTISPECIES: hypothetical protein [unclassified Bradyrhizobium]MCK1337823.1 hypothetical protein [Bradyrhizobium sp. 38]MCK1777237.1 hypothetical protein [Bradyrhizobium sp. 132]